MVDRERVVIVGAGGAGLRAAERLRELDFTGELVIISEEPYRPYHRPALTKQLLTGAVRPKDIVLPVLDELDATWRYGVRAARLEPDEHILHLPGDEQIPYDGLIIATGAQGRHLPGAPRHDPRVHVLRTIADAVAIQKAIANGRGTVAVVGGGFVGCEVASAARELGRDATIITRDDTLFGRVPGPGLSETVFDLHRRNGVQVVTNATVSHWVPRSDGIAMHLSTGQVVVAGCVVLGVGGFPAVDWLRGSGLILDDGVMCEATCHAVGVRDIVVAGDVARWPNLLFDSQPRRVEHWLNAVEMGRHAAANLLVGHGAATPFTPVPRFWSDQHGVKIQAAGLPALAQDTVPLAGSVKMGNRVTGYVSNGQLVGIVGWDSPRGMLRWTAELEKQLETAASARPAVERFQYLPAKSPAELVRPPLDEHRRPVQQYEAPVQEYRAPIPPPSIYRPESTVAITGRMPRIIEPERPAEITGWIPRAAERPEEITAPIPRITESPAEVTAPIPVIHDLSITQEIPIRHDWDRDYQELLGAEVTRVNRTNGFSGYFEPVPDPYGHTGRNGSDEIRVPELDPSPLRAVMT
jgi:NADPH-dependent 2,4-dienoyl-CoA reductase/sulfur reductase-like enzyme